MSSSLVALASAGLPGFISTRLTEGQTVTITVAVAGTPVVLADTTKLIVVQDKLGGGITYTPSTGLFAVATQNGTGLYRAECFVGNMKGINSKVPTMQWFAKENGVAAAAKGSKVTKTEPAAAVEGPCGVVVGFLNLSAIGDTAEIRCDSTSNGDTLVFKGCKVILTKVG